MPRDRYPDDYDDRDDRYRGRDDRDDRYDDRERDNRHDDRDRDDHYDDRDDRPRRRHRDDDWDDDYDYGRRPREVIPNYLVQAILCTLFCCVPFGIVAIVYAAQVNEKANRGYYSEARVASDKARTWCWLSFILGIIAVPIVIAVQLAVEQQL